ncbi:MAG TPA: GNAT family N-acetyltransferase [Solirubrobacteraceae bacterium]|nr:GNAT family N-acetyltransferase [Solirubrobacteraceae bacterium]
MHVRSWQVGYRDLLPAEYLGSLRPRDRALHYTFGDPDPLKPATIVAVEGDTICGFATTGPAGNGDGTGELLALYVDPDRWGLGIGRSLLADARARMARRGCERAILWMLVGNVRAERFYRIDGWAPTGTRRQDTLWAVTVAEIGYGRPLT